MSLGVVPKSCLRLKSGERVVLKTRVCSFRVKSNPAPSSQRCEIGMHTYMCSCACVQVRMTCKTHFFPHATVYLTPAAKGSKSMSGPRRTQAYSDPMGNHDMPTVLKPRGPDLDRKGHHMGLHLSPVTCYLNLTLPDGTLNPCSS